MLSLLTLLAIAWVLPAQSIQRPHVDVSKTTVGTPVVVAEIDTGKLKGEVRRLAWSPDGAMLYLQTAEGNPPLEALHHYSIAVVGGTIDPLAEEPEWAALYWAVKQDRVAPGVESLVIDVVQGTENIKNGVGQVGVLDRESSPDAVAKGTPSVDSLANGNMGNERAKVVRLSLLGTDIATWTNERPIPGMRFSWGPRGSGALVYVGDQGHLVFFDQMKHTKTISKVKDALLPAWSADGERLAFLQKTGRKKYLILWVPVD